MSAYVLTGAASGIGLELARLLHDRGDTVVALVHAEDRARELVAALPEVLTEVADLADASSAVTAGERLASVYSSVDGVVHAAGVLDLFAVADLDLPAWQRQLDVNLTAPAVLTSALLAPLRAAGGTVVFVNSGAGLAANPAWSAYAASKFGLRALADALRAEEPDIRVTTVYPGRTATAMQERVHHQEGAAYEAGRWIRPQTVAAAILGVLDLPADAVLPDLTLRPRPA